MSESDRPSGADKPGADKPGAGKTTVDKSGADKPGADKPIGAKADAADVLAVLPLRDIVVFPHMIVPLFVGREKSVRALEAVMKEDKQILLVAQKNATQDDPSAEDIYRIGTVSTILQLLKLPDGTVKVLVEGNSRAAVLKFTDQEDLLVFLHHRFQRADGFFPPDEKRHDHVREYDDVTQRQNGQHIGGHGVAGGGAIGISHRRPPYGRSGLGPPNLGTVHASPGNVSVSRHRIFAVPSDSARA